MEDKSRAQLPARRPLERQWHRVVYPRGQSPLVFVALSDFVEGVWTHWDDAIDRTTCCYDPEKCVFCKAGQPRRFTGYVAGMILPARDFGAVSVTDHAARQLRELRLLDSGLRGKQVTLFRQLPHKNAPVHVQISGWPTKETLPKPFDVRPHLQRLWGFVITHREQIERMQKNKIAHLDAIKAGLLKGTE